MKDKQSEVYKLTAKLADDWAENAEQHIHDTVNEMLTDRIKEMVLHICGFEKDYIYKQWKVDHCNNRSGNSPAGQVVAEAVHDRLKYLIGNLQLTEGELAELRCSARDHYLKSYHTAMKREAERLAKQHAIEYTRKEVGNALNGSAESVRLRLMESVNPTNP